MFSGSCLFGIAISDLPKGDLNGDGIISGPSETVVENSFAYPYGTSEGFPQFEDTALNIQADTAHGYAECSNAVIDIYCISITIEWS